MAENGEWSVLTSVYLAVRGIQRDTKKTIIKTFPLFLCLDKMHIELIYQSGENETNLNIMNRVGTLGR